jgi:uncharacterized membrane protein
MIFVELIFAFLLRLFSLNQSFWLDEATSGLVARNFNLVDIITKFSPGDFHPPLYYLILKVWSYTFGTSEIALRLPSIIFGLLTIYLIYLIGKDLFNKKVGLMAGILLATSGLHIYYSQEARMYALTAFLVTFSIFSFMKILKNDRLGDWILFSILLLLITSADYVAILIIPVFWIFGILTKKNLKWFLKLLMSHIILILFAIIWSPIFLKQLGVGISINSSSPSWANLLGTFSFKNFALIPVKFLLGRISFDNKYVYTSVVGLFLGLITYPILLSLNSLRKTLIIWLWLVLPVLLGLLISLRLSIFSYFRFLFCLPAFYLLIAIGLEKLKPKVSNVLIIVFVAMNILFSGIYLFNPRFQREDWKGLTTFIKKESNNKSVVLFVADSNMEGYKYYDSSANISGPEGFSNQYREIWLMRYLQPVFDAKDLLRAKIEASGYNREKEYDFNGVVVWKYTK